MDCSFHIFFYLFLYFFWFAAIVVYLPRNHRRAAIKETEATKNIRLVTCLLRAPGFWLLTASSFLLPPCSLLLDPGVSFCCHQRHKCLHLEMSACPRTGKSSWRPAGVYARFYVRAFLSSTLIVFVCMRN